MKNPIYLSTKINFVPLPLDIKQRSSLRVLIMGGIVLKILDKQKSMKSYSKVVEIIQEGPA